MEINIIDTFVPEKLFQNSYLIDITLLVELITLLTSTPSQLVPSHLTHKSVATKYSKVYTL